MLPWDEKTILIYGGEAAAKNEINDGVIANVADKTNIVTEEYYPANNSNLCFSFPNNSYIVTEDKTVRAAGVEFQAESHNESIIELKFNTDRSVSV